MIVQVAGQKSYLTRSPSSYWFIIFTGKSFQNIKVPNVCLAYLTVSAMLKAGLTSPLGLSSVLGPALPPAMRKVPCSVVQLVWPHFCHQISAEVRHLPSENEEQVCHPSHWWPPPQAFNHMMSILSRLRSHSDQRAGEKRKKYFKINLSSILCVQVSSLRL